MNKQMKEQLAKAESTIRQSALRDFEGCIDNVRKAVKALVGDADVSMAQDLLDDEFQSLIKNLISGVAEAKSDTNPLACAIAENMVSRVVI